MQAIIDPSILLRIAEKLLIFERPLLVTLPDSSADRLNQIADLRSVPPGCLISAAGTLPPQVFLLFRGEAVIRIPGARGASVKRIRPGEILGIPESCCRLAPKYEIMAVSKCSIGVLSATRFESFLERDQEARDCLIDTLGKGTQSLYRFVRHVDD